MYIARSGKNKQDEKDLTPVDFPPPNDLMRRFVCSLNLSGLMFLYVNFQVCCNGVLLGTGSRREAEVPAACPVPHRVPCSFGGLCLNSSLRFCSGPLVIDQHYPTTGKTAPDRHKTCFSCQ